MDGWWVADVDGVESNGNEMKVQREGVGLEDAFGSGDFLGEREREIG